LKDLRDIFDLSEKQKSKNSAEFHEHKAELENKLRGLKSDHNLEIAKIQSEINRITMEKNLAEAEFTNFKEKCEMEVGVVKNAGNLELVKLHEKLEKVMRKKEAAVAEATTIKVDFAEQIAATKLETETKIAEHKAEIERLKKEKSEISRHFLSDTQKLERDYFDREANIRKNLEFLKKELSSEKSESPADPEFPAEHGDIQALKAQISRLGNEKILLEEHFGKEKEQIRQKQMEEFDHVERQLLFEKMRRDKLEEEFKAHKAKL